MWENWEGAKEGLRIAMAQLGLYLGIAILINLTLWWRDSQMGESKERDAEC